MRGASLVTAMLLALVACDALPGRPRPSDRPQPASRPDFAALYAANCAGCHGDDTRPGAAIALADPVYLALVDDATLARVTRDGVPGTSMPAFRLRADELDTIVRGMRARWARRDTLAGIAAPPYAAPAGDAVRGERAFAARCASCHGSGGTGGPHGGSVVDGAYLALVSDQGLRTAILVGRPALGMPDWRGAGARAPMTADEIADVVAWLKSKRTGFPDA
jgi:mono/diheme cytochrome c family protein